MRIARRVSLGGVTMDRAELILWMEASLAVLAETVAKLNGMCMCMSNSNLRKQCLEVAHDVQQHHDDLEERLNTLRQQS